MVIAPPEMVILVAVLGVKVVPNVVRAYRHVPFKTSPAQEERRR